MPRALYPAKDPAETYPISLTISDVDAAGGEAITSILSTTVAVEYGADPAKDDFVSGVPTFSGATVTPTLTAGVDGVNYAIRFEVLTDRGNTYVGVAVVPVRAS